MSDKVLGYLLQGLSVLLHVVAAVALVAAFRALTVTTTLAAVESAFGALVICVLLAVFARKAWQIGSKKRSNVDA